MTTPELEFPSDRIVTIHIGGQTIAGIISPENFEWLAKGGGQTRIDLSFYMEGNYIEVSDMLSAFHRQAFGDSP